MIKGFHLRSRQTIKSMRHYARGAAGKAVWAFLLDSYTKGVSGGTGKQFNWELARAAKRYHKRIFLAGGINAQNVRRAIREIKPFAVDLCSGVELAPGKKSSRKLKEFFQQVKKRYLGRAPH